MTYNKNIMGGRSSKSYRYSPTGNQQCGQAVTALGIVLGGIAVFLDELTSIYSDSDDNEPSGWCGWEAEGAWGSDFLFSSNDAVYTASYYRYCCDNDCPLSFFSSLFDTPDTKDYCDTETAGSLWLAFSIFALVLALTAVGAIQVNYDRSSKCADWAATIAGIIAVVCWVADNPICYDDDSVDDEEQRLGP